MLDLLVKGNAVIYCHTKEWRQWMSSGCALRDVEFCVPCAVCCALKDVCPAHVTVDDETEGPTEWN